MDRFTIYKSEAPTKPWVVQDNATPAAEDATLYRFSSKKKAGAFRDMLVREAAAKGYRVFERRVVPVGKGLLHEGEHGVCVILDDSHSVDGAGFMAWGFAPDADEAEQLAVTNAKAVRDSRAAA